MEYEKHIDKIVINDLSEFSLDHIFECGQVFRYLKTANGYVIISKDQKCVLSKENDCAIIETSNIGYFENYFDLSNDYAQIKRKLAEDEFMREALGFGHGIRLLRQDPEEMLISFIISANNNIPRIRKTIEKLCDLKGTDCGGYMSFPTAFELRDSSEDFFRSIGAGYRASYLTETIEALNSWFDMESLAFLETDDARRQLMKLKGVGRKVADCIMLFGLHRTECFPTDTWIEKVHERIFGKSGKSAIRKSDELGKYFGDLSGYAQQYLFYYARETYKTTKPKQLNKL